MSKFEFVEGSIPPAVIHLPSFEDFEVSSEAVKADFPETHRHIPMYLLDNRYWYVKHEDWGKIFADVLQNKPRFTTEKFDCDDFAFLIKARVTEKYKINAIAIALGTHNEVSHAYNMFYDEFGWHLLEPQTGLVCDMDEEGYHLIWLIM